jgi:hypothetical protein
VQDQKEKPALQAVSKNETKVMSGSFLNKPIHRKKEKFQNRIVNHNQNPIVLMCQVCQVEQRRQGQMCLVEQKKQGQMTNYKSKQRHISNYICKPFSFDIKFCHFRHHALKNQHMPNKELVDKLN